MERNSLCGKDARINFKHIIKFKLNNKTDSSFLSVKQAHNIPKLCIMWAQQINSLFSFLNVLATAAATTAQLIPYRAKSIEKAAKLNEKKNTLCSAFIVLEYITEI